MKNKKQSTFVQILAFFTAALSVIFLRQYYQGKSHFKPHQSAEDKFFTPQPKIFLESAEVPLTEEIVVTPIEN